MTKTYRLASVTANADIAPMLLTGINREVDDDLVIDLTILFSTDFNDDITINDITSKATDKIVYSTTGITLKELSFSANVTDLEVTIRF